MVRAAFAGEALALELGRRPRFEATFPDGPPAGWPPPAPRNRIMTRYDLLRRTWLAAGVAINDGATRVAVARFEKDRHLVLPGGFREYLLTVNGMRDWKADEEGLSFFSLERIDQETNEVQTGAKAGRLVIADFLTFSHCYVLRIGEDGDDRGVWPNDGTNERLLAPTFDVFVDMYLTDPSKIANCWA